MTGQPWILNGVRGRVYQWSATSTTIVNPGTSVTMVPSGGTGTGALDLQLKTRRRWAAWRFMGYAQEPNAAHVTPDYAPIVLSSADGNNPGGMVGPDWTPVPRSVRDWQGQLKLEWSGTEGCAVYYEVFVPDEECSK